MSSPEPMLPADSRVFTSPVRMAPRPRDALAEDHGDGKWPVWIRLLTIIGLSIGLWSLIIWAVVSVFG